MTSVGTHRLPLAASAEFAPVGRLTVTLVTGTSGVVAKLVVGTPLVIFVLPTTITVMPSACNTRSRSGKASPPWDTKIAGPAILVGSTGVLARAVPTIDPAGQANGLAANVASGHAF